MAIKRREAREQLLTLLYEMSFETIGARGDRTPEEVYANAVEIRSLPDDEYVKKVFFSIWEHQYEIDALIEKYAEGWRADRISRVTSSIMRLAIYEMMYEELPVGIAINEAVELAKKFDYDKAPKFINGILNKIAEENGLKGEKTSDE